MAKTISTVAELHLLLNGIVELNHQRNPIMNEVAQRETDFKLSQAKSTFYSAEIEERVKTFVNSQILELYSIDKNRMTKYLPPTINGIH